MANEERKRMNDALHCAILPLNNALPEHIQHLWVTLQEMHERLIYAGVPQSLTLSHVQNALRYKNRYDKHVVTRKFGGVTYYRSVNANVEEGDKITCPLDQRFRGGTSTGSQHRIFIYPERNYFKGRGAPNDYFTTIITALDELNGEWYMLDNIELYSSKICDHLRQIVSLFKMHRLRQVKWVYRLVLK